MPTPQDFCGRALFRLSPDTGEMECMLDGVEYDVIPFGDDAVQVVTKYRCEPVATLGMTSDGRFVVAGEGA